MAFLTRKINKIPLGIYVHVPFCRSKCAYCDFYSLTTKDYKIVDGYLDAVCAHIKESGSLAPGYRVDTIYFGGGTPTFFGADGMATILTTIRRNFDVDNNAEITFEANPDSISDRLLHRLHAEGFNRVSLGVQTDDDEILKKIGRPHNYAQAVTAIDRIKRAGFKNLSLDLIYGLPGQTLRGWEETLDHVLRQNPEHISCYGLKLEPGTPLYEYRDQYEFPSDDDQADMYLAAVENLESRGYRQYEISNFCKKGMYSYLSYSKNAADVGQSYRRNFFARLKKILEENYRAKNGKKRVHDTSDAGEAKKPVSGYFGIRFMQTE